MCVVLIAQVPMIMGVLGVWYNNFFGAQSHALLPYDQVHSNSLVTEISNQDDILLHILPVK